jgi:hypothetical protein
LGDRSGKIPVIPRWLEAELDAIGVKSSPKITKTPVKDGPIREVKNNEPDF